MKKDGEIGRTCITQGIGENIHKSVSVNTWNETEINKCENMACIHLTEDRDQALGEKKMILQVS
jgi:hypothetical protein